MANNELKTLKHEKHNKNKNSLLLPKTLRLFIIICNTRKELIKPHHTHIFVAYDKNKRFPKLDVAYLKQMLCVKYNSR